MSRRQQVIELLSIGRRTLDDDEIAARLDMNRHYVNQVCRKLAADGTVERFLGRDSKYVNRLVDTGAPTASADLLQPAHTTEPRRRRDVRERANIETLVADCGLDQERPAQRARRDQVAQPVDGGVMAVREADL